MLGKLPKSLEINGKEIAINSDFRVALINFEAIGDPDLTNQEKAFILLDSIYGIDNLSEEDYEEAMQKACWFLDGGQKRKQKTTPKVMDWAQDEAMIFSAVNKVAGKETRECTYIHWWTWLGYFMEIGDDLFSQVLNIRQKKAKGKKLEKYEKEFEKEHEDIVILKSKLSIEEQQEKDQLLALLEGGEK